MRLFILKNLRSKYGRSFTSTKITTTGNKVLCLCVPSSPSPRLTEQSLLIQKLFQLLIAADFFEIIYFTFLRHPMALSEGGEGAE